jgi:HD-like signal output (HDOD) protein
MSALSVQPPTDAETARAVADLPPVSTVLQRILAVLRDAHSDLRDITKLVRAETSIAAQIMRLANSAFYAPPEPISSIDVAIQRLGFAEVSRLVSALASRQLFLRPLNRANLTAEKIWQHTLTVATCAEAIANHSRTDHGVAYLAGILHPVGILALDQVALARNVPARGAEQSLRDWEEAHFGTNNAAVAAVVLRHWKFPESLAATVAGRYFPVEAGANAPAAAVLHLASCVAERLDCGLPSEKSFFPPTQDRIEAAGLHWGDFGDLEIECGQMLQRTRTMLNLA